MGANQSSPLEGSTIGFHILEIEPDSAAEKAGLEVYFDYITHCNGIRLNEDPSILRDYISENKPLPLIVYSSKTMSLRMVSIVGKHLGLKAKACSFEDAHERVWHVLEVQKDSPSSVSGLISNTDYIIGSPHRTLHRKEDFLNLVKDFKGKQLTLYVYNSDLDSIRNVIIIPDLWEGDGLIGCDIAYGNLHRIALSKEPMTRENSGSNLPGGLVTDHDHSGHAHSGHAHSHADHNHSHHGHSDHNNSHSGHTHDDHSHHNHSDQSHSHDHAEHNHGHNHSHQHDHPHTHNHSHEEHGSHSDHSHHNHHSAHTHAHDHNHAHGEHRSIENALIDTPVEQSLSHSNHAHVHFEDNSQTLDNPVVSLSNPKPEPISTNPSNKTDLMTQISPLNQPTFAPAAIPHPSMLNDTDRTPLLNVEDDYIHDISGVPSLSWSSKTPPRK
ncbi:Golgi reassembly-stacking protein 2 [Terramyces sp. JEL0728]|nr:Golgi reassembly-stacking protein 2 [Terramyces sp. JEL0728]